MTNPYSSLPSSAFWKPAVASRNMLEITQLWTAKNLIDVTHSVATSGSCFAQHISRAMIRNGFNWVDAEPAPAKIPETLRKSFGYGVFSFRTGNIYTASALRQWVEAAFGVRPLDDEIWEQDGRFYDPLRPAIEPDGFASAEECRALRHTTLAAMRRVLSEVDLFVFTLGLTESWRNRATGFTYAACPGTIAGTFSEQEHEFHNQTYPEILADMQAALECIRAHNPAIKFLLTVSPVPLVATAAPAHVLVSTTYSKSVLRAVAGDLSTQRPDTDYFPSYEIITATPFKAAFFMPNQREVATAGVNFVMSHFFAGLGLQDGGAGAAAPSQRAAAAGPDTPPEAQDPGNDIQCEEALLEAFAK